MHGDSLEGVLGEDAFEILGRDPELEGAPESDGDVAALLADDNGQGVGFLRNAQCGPVAQSQLLGHCHVVGDGKDAACGGDALVGDNHAAVMQGGVLEEDVFNEPLRDFGIEEFSGAYKVVQRQRTLHDDEGTHLLFRHRQAGHDDGYDVLAGVRLLVLAAEETHGCTYTLVGADGKEELADFVLKEDEQRDGTYADNAVEQRAQQAHFQDLGDEQPKDDEYQHAEEDVQRARLFHQAVAVIEQERNEKDVEEVFQAEGKEHVDGTF